jgi:hypothetical protein
MMRLDADDVLPDRKNVFFLYDFPKEWKRSHVLDVFKNFDTINVKWIGDTEVRVVLDHECVEDMLDAIRQNEVRSDRQYSICTDEFYRTKRVLKGMWLPFVSTTSYRQACPLQWARQVLSRAT